MLSRLMVVLGFVGATYVFANTGWECAQPPIDGQSQLTFPSSFGEQKNYQLEWWYYTGNLTSPDLATRHMGFQLTVIRYGASPLLPDSHLYMAHLTVTAPGHGPGFFFAETPAGSATVQSDPFALRLDNGVHQVALALEQGVAGEQGATYTLKGKSVSAGVPFAISLRVQDRKGTVLQGDHGYSLKSYEPCAASNYFSLTGLEIAGEDSQLQVGDTTYKIDGGQVWMDREYSSSQLSQVQKGWDWFSLHLNDGSDLMLFNMRESNNPNDFNPDFTYAKIISPDRSNDRRITASDFKIDVQDYWTSPTTHTKYPAKWKISIPGENIELNITPVTSNQELVLRASNLNYWEGAATITGNTAQGPVEGTGYVEMTGYFPAGTPN